MAYRKKNIDFKEAICEVSCYLDIKLGKFVTRFHLQKGSIFEQWIDYSFVTFPHF